MGRAIVKPKRPSLPFLTKSSLTIDCNLPNALVYDMVDDATDDILVVSTLGRGAWSLTQASTLVVAQFETEVDFSAENLVVIDINGGATLDALTVSRVGANIRVSDTSNESFADLRRYQTGQCHRYSRCTVMCGFVQPDGCGPLAGQDRHVEFHIRANRRQSIDRRSIDGIAGQ
jgi:hypothetical protein